MIDKPSDKEQEYFIRKDLERIKAMRDEHVAKQQEAERAKLKELHFMHCPKCGMKMQEVPMRGVDVDVCFSCNGIFLDQGELEHLEKPESKGVMSSILNWFKPETTKKT